MNNIWNEWKNHYKELGISGEEICQDGIVNEEKYRISKERVLFVLKETYEFSGHVKEFIMEPKNNTWKIGLWAVGILNGFPPFEKINNDVEAKKEALLSIAWINLKKISGGNVSDERIINAYAFTDRYLLKNQINDIDPTIIVACGNGVFDSLLWLLEPDNLPVEVYQNSPVWDRFSWKICKVVRMIHPSSRNMSNEASYNRLSELLNY